MPKTIKKKRNNFLKQLRTQKPVVRKLRLKISRRLKRPDTGRGLKVIKTTRTKDVVLILDFGSQYTQLIARRVRENKVFSKIVPYNISVEEIENIGPKGLILSGGPMSVYDKDAPMPHKDIFKM